MCLKPKQILLKQNQKMIKLCNLITGIYKMRAEYIYEGLLATLSPKFLTNAMHFTSNTQTTCTSTKNKQFQQSLSKKFTSSNPIEITNNFHESKNAYCFPKGLEEALSAQSCNIAKFKKRVEKQKNSLNDFFTYLCQQISHKIQDFKLSLFAKLDIQYQQYLSQYAELKNEVETFQMQRKLIKMQSTPTLLTTPIHDNKQLIMEMKRTEEEYKNRHIQSKLLQMEPRCKSNLQKLVSNLLIIGSSKQTIINYQTLRIRSEELKNVVNRYLEPLYGDLNEFIAKSILQDHGLVHSNSGLNQIYINQQIIYQPKPLPTNQVQKIDYCVNIPIQRIKHKQSPNFMVVFPQNLVVQEGNNVRIKDNFCIRSLHTDKTLCCVGYKDHIITGGKDSIVTVNSLDGEKVVTLRGHKAGVCCITTIRSGSRTFVASGGDLGCGNLILWDTEKWGIFTLIPAHNAAVSCIIDSGDGETLITSSYDKSIKVINYLRQQIVFCHNCSKPLISLAINTNKSRIVSVDLSQTISVWEVFHRNKSISKLQLTNQIQNDSINTIALFSMTNKQMIVSGDRRGFIKVWNIQSSKCISSYKCHESLVVDMILIDRLNKKDFPFIVSVGKKDKFLTLTDTQTNTIKRVNLKNQINIELGCGIGPKMFMIQNTPYLQLGLVSQSEDRKEVQICELQIQ